MKILDSDLKCLYFKRISSNTQTETEHNEQLSPQPSHKLPTAIKKYYKCIPSYVRTLLEFESTPNVIITYYPLFEFRLALAAHPVYLALRIPDLRITGEAHTTAGMTEASRKVQSNGIAP